MASSPVLPPSRHVPFKKGGWGAAILTTAAAAVLFLTAWYIHSQTYRHPSDYMMRTYPRTDAAHGAAAGHDGAGATGAPHDGATSAGAHGSGGASAGAAHGGSKAPAAGGAGH